MSKPWLISPEDFNVVYQAVDEEPFELHLVNDGSVALQGQIPDADSSELVFNYVRTNSTAHTFLSAAWNNNQLLYVFTVNGIILAFHTPLGWSFIPPNQYITGRLPKGFPGAYELAIGVIKNVINPISDHD